jgi:hypothetical protein
MRDLTMKPCNLWFGNTHSALKHFFRFSRTNLLGCNNHFLGAGGKRRFPENALFNIRVVALVFATQASLDVQTSLASDLAIHIIDGVNPEVGAQVPHFTNGEARLPFLLRFQAHYCLATILFRIQSFVEDRSRMDLVTMKIFSFLVLFPLLFGCSKTYYLSPLTVDEHDLTDTRGALIGSFSRHPDAKMYLSQAIYFKNLETGESRSIYANFMDAAFNSPTPDDFKEKESVGGVFVMPLEAGEYAFTGFRLTYKQSTLIKSVHSNEPLSVPFKVHAGKVNYVGQLKRTVLSLEKNGSRSTYPAWLISERMERDTKLISEKHPDVPLHDIANVVPTEDNSKSPLIVIPSELDTLPGEIK